jgi:alpha-1,2-mannosyltransferase
VPTWVLRGGPIVLAVALLLHLLVYIFFPTYFLQIDVLVYRFGGVRVLHGLDLYSIGRNGETDNLLFTYTPFAALAFVPLAFLNDPVTQVLMLIADWALLTGVVYFTLRYFGVTRSDGLRSLTMLLVGLLSWLEPIRLSVQLGQINVLTLVVVMAGVLAPARRRWAAVGIGVVAGIKLTPMIFIVYLALLRKWRAACVAAATLAATFLLGFALLPAASKFYWIDRGFDDVKRITTTPDQSTSIRGLFMRLHYSTGLAMVLAVVVMALSLWVAVIAHRRGYGVLAVAIVGMASAAASPFSWSHHWVWFVPLVIHLGYRGYILHSRLSAWTMWGFCLLFAAWFTSLTGRTPNSSLLSLRPGGIWNALIPSTYVFVLLITLVATAIWLRREAATSAVQAGLPTDDA